MTRWREDATCDDFGSYIFLKDVRSEMRKVISPSREEVQATTVTVLITVFVFAAYFWLVDSIFGSAIQAMLHKLTKH